VSEYQYYEFQAIDRPLTDKEQAYMRSLSSRVELTRHHAAFTYHYGDFRGDPEKVLAKYFDAMLYVANWGSKRLMFRLPRALVDSAALLPYEFPEVILTEKTSDHIILDISTEDEEGFGWIEGEGILSSLVGLRDELLRGDFRSLYLMWLHAIKLAEETEDVDDLPEPPVPANLQTLSTSLKHLIEFFEIDEDLIAVAATASASQGNAPEPEIDKLIARLSEQERNNFLARVAKGEPHIDRQLLNRLRELSPNKPHKPTARGEHTALELLAAAREHHKQRRERQRQTAERARIRKLDAMVEKEPQLWEQVTALIEKKQPKAYDEAVSILKDLRDLAQHFGRLEGFQARIDKLHDDYRSRPGLLSRLQRAGLAKAKRTA